MSKNLENLSASRPMEDVAKLQSSKEAQLILVLGGARSGKSSFAERLALRSERRVAFIATATAEDKDMEDRIMRHRAMRPAEWCTIEEPLDLVSAIQQAARVADVLLLDCITLWLANWLMTQADPDFEQEPALIERYSALALKEVERLLVVFRGLDADQRLVVVSNEVGLGIVPAYPLGRAYRDILGRINQCLASSAARVYLMVAGLAVDIRRLHEEAAL